jgi:hypothetical protein
MAELPKQPYIYEGLDPDMPTKSAVQAFTETLRDGLDRASHAFEAAKKPGMPLSILSNVAKEAPLGALFAAFVVGVIVGRR